ncbi:S53 family peptidase [Paludibacterium paludis]|uniref:Kumamolisin n=1 Tax=Paludibacterium paludis TaxID=1225769 RepID=A0A918P1B4_9NEIS|nr:S53 family peptidase [Paludibacterium paludis]GGY11918.1 kumamolisin [Paludibacterium paludis]
MHPATHILLTGSERIAMPGSHLLGRTDPDEHIDITVKVRRAHPLPDLSCRPDDVLGRDDFTERYGAASGDLQAVVDALGCYGLNLTAMNGTTRTVRLAGPSSAMEAAFATQLADYAHPSGRFRGRLGPLAIPRELDGIVEGVFGLDTRRVVKRRWQAMKHLDDARDTAASRDWFYPGEVASAYQFPHGDGKGQIVALLEFGGGYFSRDLTEFCRETGIPVPTVIPQSIDATPTNRRDGAQSEVMLDIEIIAGLCPAATIPVYFGAGTEQGWVDAFDAALHNPDYPAHVISISWGNSEDHGAWTPMAIRVINDSLMEAALLGVTVCAASGDDGSDDQVGDGLAHADFPAASPYVLAVGGTRLARRDGGFEETAWMEGIGLRQRGGGCTGGGVSRLFACPPWQQDVAVESVNPGAGTGRCVPDVAANASLDTGYFIVVDGKRGISGGTSAAAPVWAALVARVNQQLGGMETVGYLTPLLYQHTAGGQTLGALGCHEITRGNNITATAGGYAAGPGYNAVAGWGSPMGLSLLSVLRPALGHH